MTKSEYLRSLHDLAYQANLADAPDRREDWQTADMASTHAQPLLDIVRSLMNAREFEVFCDCFGDFDSFLYNIEREQ